MEMPQWVLDIANDADAANPDAGAAVEAAINEVFKSPQLPTWRDTLVKHAIQNQVYAARHRRNLTINRQNGNHIPQPQVTGLSSAVAEVYESVWSFRIAGRELGLITGAELPDLEATERQQANGHLFNAELLKRLQSRVRPNQTVRQAVPETQLRRLWREVGAEFGR